MPVQIGAKRESAFDNPIGLLTDCHRRIENFLSVLLGLGEQAHGMPLDSERRASLETALRYFRESAPKHTADEEDSLFPRLRSIDRADVQRALASIAALESDHAAAALRHAELDELGQRWLDSGSLNASNALRFNSVARELHALYQTHIAVEERARFSRLLPLQSTVINVSRLRAKWPRVAVCGTPNSAGVARRFAIPQAEDAKRRLAQGKTTAEIH